MGASASRSDFTVSFDPEPHCTRRKAILKAHPEVKQLMGHDPMMKYQLLAIVLIQFTIVYLIQDLPWKFLIPLTIVVSGTLNHVCSVSLHELSHNLAFGYKRPLANRLLGMWAALPTAVPSSYTFKKYHLDHHKFLGDEYLDPDLPSYPERVLCVGPLTKFIWLLSLPLLYGFRPALVNFKPYTPFELVTYVTQISLDIFVLRFLGVKSLFYMLGGTYFGLSGLHPIAGHFISEHYTFTKGYETFSYYGPLNYITFNLGYHNEHHDFPNIPGCNLPRLKAMAPEFYDHLPSHTSWVKVLLDFMLDRDIGPHSRVIRANTKYRMTTDDPTDTLVEKDDFYLGLRKTPDANGNVQKKVE